jgi:hypothetical protein
VTPKEKTIRVADVRTFETKSGNTRFVLRDESGNEYTTFREEIGRTALVAQRAGPGSSYHEEQRDGFHNVHLDAVVPLDKPAESDERVDEAAWKTAVDSAPAARLDAPRTGGSAGGALRQAPALQGARRRRHQGRRGRG